MIVLESLMFTYRMALLPRPTMLFQIALLQIRSTISQLLFQIECLGQEVVLLIGLGQEVVLLIWQIYHVFPIVGATIQ